MGKRKNYRITLFFGISECHLLGHDSRGISLIFTQVNTFLRWLNEKEEMSRYFLYKKVKNSQSEGSGFCKRRDSATLLATSQEWNEAQSTKNSLKTLVILAGLLHCIHLFSLNVVFPLETMFLDKYRNKFEGGSCPLSRCGYQRHLMLSQC